MIFRLYLQVLTKIWLVSKFGQLAGGFLIDFPSMGLIYLAILGIFMVRPAGFVKPLEAPKIGYSRKISHNMWASDLAI